MLVALNTFTLLYNKDFFKSGELIKQGLLWSPCADVHRITMTAAAPNLDWYSRKN